MHGAVLQLEEGHKYYQYVGMWLITNMHCGMKLKVIIQSATTIKQNFV